MTKMRCGMRAFTQMIVEVDTILDSVSARRPFLAFRDNAKAWERVAAVRAGTRKVGFYG